jgi:hypothetical protein
METQSDWFVLGNKLTISTDAVLSPSALIARGQYDVVPASACGLISAILQQTSQTRGRRPGPTLALIGFKDPVSMCAVHQTLSETGLQAATFEELLAVGNQFPHLLEKYLIVAVGTVWKDDRGDERVPCLDMTGLGRRSLRLCWSAEWCMWLPSARFLTRYKQ